MKLTRIDYWIVDAGRLAGLPVTRFTVGPGPAAKTTLNGFIVENLGKLQLPLATYIDVLPGTPKEELLLELEALKSKLPNLRVIVRTRDYRPAPWMKFADYTIRLIEAHQYLGAPASEYHMIYSPNLKEDPFIRLQGDTTALYLVVRSAAEMKAAVTFSQEKLIRSNAWQFALPPIFTATIQVWPPTTSNTTFKSATTPTTSTTEENKEEETREQTETISEDPID